MKTEADKYPAGAEGGGRGNESTNADNIALTGKKGKEWIFPRASGGNMALCSLWFQPSETHS